jgi:hypothetical protein
MDVEGCDLSAYGTEEPEPLGNWSRWARIRRLWGKGLEQKSVGLVGRALRGGSRHTAHHTRPNWDTTLARPLMRYTAGAFKLPRRNQGPAEEGGRGRGRPDEAEAWGEIPLDDVG